MRYRLTAQYADQHAVVLGAGLAGLLAARVLAEHFAQVTVIADHALADDPAQPTGIEQVIPAHLLSIQGQRDLERLFPGLQTELLAAGAPTIDWTADAPLRLPDGWGPRFQSDLVTRSASPNRLAHIIRQRVVDYSRGCVTFVAGQIVHVEADGVQLQDTRIDANLVVDTLGRETRLTQWVADLGYEPPVQTEVSASVGVAARLYRQPRHFDPGWKALLILPQTGAPGGVLVPVEEDGWLVMLVGCDGDDPPATEAEFADFAPAPLADALRQAQPLTPVYSTHHTANHWWHIERLSRWPDHFLTTSAAAYNPVYGLELTTATLAALTLRDVLNEQRKNSPSGTLEGLGMRFQKRLARASDLPWRMVTAVDGSRTSPPLDHLGRFACWFGGHILAAARTDPEIYQIVLETAGMVTPAYTLLNPTFAHQVMRHNSSPALRTDSAAPPAFQAEASPGTT